VLLAAGVTYFIDLTRPGEMPPYDLSLPSSRPSDQRYIVYLRKSIQDHGVPDNPDLMAEILDYIDRAIEVGHCVYVHCRAGIGRTNIVVGCWLRRRGAGPGKALDLLNELWQANARSATWPRVPETDAQEAFIREWSGGEAEPIEGADLEAAKVLRDKYLGALIGLACGDALGASSEMQKPGGFAPIGDLIGGGPWQLPPGAWTDDTAMALCLADSLLACEGFDARDQLARYVDWQRNGYMSSTQQCVGITAAVAKALAAAQWSGKLMTGSHDPKRLEPDAIVRAGVVALFAAGAPARVFEWAADAARLTHQAPGVLDACRWYASLVLAALQGATIEDLLPRARELLAEHYGKPLTSHIERLADAARPPGARPLRSNQTHSALGTVLWAMGSERSFRDSALKLANLGGNADVLGALHGLLGGALHGVSRIPSAWRSNVAQQELLESTADRLLAAALAPQ
jgi:ADP-ribosylglycohydrolase